MVRQKSFTLIELLVVIAIIGILAATIIVVLSNAKKKAHFARIQTDLAQIKRVAEMWFDDHGNYEGFCNKTGEDYDNKDLDRLVKDVIANGGEEPVCNDSELEYAVSSLFPSQDNGWCVDTQNSLRGEAVGTSCRTLANNPTQPTNLSYFHIIQGDMALTSAQINFLVSHFDNLLIKGSYSSAKVEALKNAAASQGRSIKIFMYTDGSFSIAYRPPDNSMAYAHNQDSTNSNYRIKETEYDQGWWLMDLCSTEWRDYFVSQATTNINDRGVDGIMVDDMGIASGINNATRIDNVPQHRVGLEWEDYTDEEWYNCGRDFLQTVKSGLAGKTVIFNGLYRNAPYFGLAYPAVTDGGIDEGWITTDYINFYNENQWKLKMNQAIGDMNNNKKFIPQCIINNPAATINDRLYCYTSYLLINKPGNITYIGPKYANRDTSIYYQPEMGVEIGNPLNTGGGLADYLSQNNLYERNYSGGKIIVNPSTASKTYNLDKDYYLVKPNGTGLVKNDGTIEGSLSYEEVSGTLSISPQTGVILLNGS